jgi:transposase InsO family protein
MAMVDVSDGEKSIDQEAKYGCPEIFNTDQGSQFTAAAFTDTLRSKGIAIIMDGKGVGWTTSLLNGSGKASSTRISI